MKNNHFANQACLLTVIALVALPVLAATLPDEHAAHHPAAAASQPSPEMGRFNDQMATMQAMHEKMMAAKSPEERAALMKNHMKAMQDGMSMMGQMRGGTGATGGPGAMTMGKAPMDGGKKPMMKGGLSADHDGMYRRMDMMEMMMQMMVDRQDAMSTTSPISSPTK